jgi:hypothetical protein
VGKVLIQGAPVSIAMSILGKSRWTVQRLQGQAPVEMEVSGLTELKEGYSVTETEEGDKEGDKEREGEVYKRVVEKTVDFFENNTGVFSGANNLVRKCSMPQFEMCCEYFAQLPNMYRDIITKQPDLLFQCKDTTRQGRGIQEAWKRKCDPNFDGECEKNLRYDMTGIQMNMHHQAQTWNKLM